MEKNWLIRTKNNHILGPVSKQKVRELLEKGSIKGDDELTCGNGYWFFVREKELVEKYVVGDMPQGFNPVSEAETVLCKGETQLDGDLVIPSEDDLAFPDMGDSSKVPDDDDLAYPTEPEDEIASEENTLDQLRNKASKKKVVKSKKTRKKNSKSSTGSNKVKVSQKNKTAQIPKSSLNQNVLYIIASVFFIIALLAFYYRRRIVKQFIEARNFVIQPVYAQVIPDAVKKKLII